MTMSRWFHKYDYNAVFNLYAIACHPRRLVPACMSDVLYLVTGVLAIASICGHLALYVIRHVLTSPQKR
jgi:hypothetical protein